MDFSGASGADGPIVLTGPSTGNVSNDGIQQVELGGSNVVLLVLSEGDAPEARVEQTTRLEGGKPIFASWDTD